MTSLSSGLNVIHKQSILAVGKKKITNYSLHADEHI